MAEVVKARLSNLSAADKEYLVELVMKYKTVVENKKTDSVSGQQKEAAWKKIELEFNANSTTARNYQQLKQVSLNLNLRSHHPYERRRCSRRGNQQFCLFLSPCCSGGVD